MQFSKINNNFPVFIATYPMPKPQVCFMENMLGFFNGQDNVYCLRTYAIMLTDKDAPFIAYLIKKNLSSPSLKSCILEREEHLTSEEL